MERQPLLGRMRMPARLRALPSSLIIGGIILILHLFVAITGPAWAPYAPNTIATGPPYEKPSGEHLFGTDQLGRDVFSRVVHGTRVDLPQALMSAALGVSAGAVIGMLSGYVGGWLDEVLMRLFDALISIPLIIAALLIITAAGPQATQNPFFLISVIALVYTPRAARMARAVAIDLATRDFVLVARARAESAWSIVRRELLPNATGTLFVEFAVRSGYAVILVGSLGFLGFGARPPTPEWGLMISENRDMLVAAPHTVVGPALAVASLVIGLNLFTEGLARVLGRSVHPEG